MAKQRPPASPRTLRDALLRQAGKRTVLGVAIPVLGAMIEAHRAGRPFGGATAAEIQVGFEALASRYLHSEFSTTYLVRPLSQRGFLERNANRYSFRPALLEGLSGEDLALLRDELLQTMQDATDRRKATIAELDRACKAPLEQLDARRLLIEQYLRNFGGTSGENFEILSYAALREYFAAFGFQLRRFSTTRSNDGGMDYVGGDCIYQVSTDNGLAKLEGDLAKAPDINRVIIRPELDEAARKRADETEFARVELTDLLEHFVGWLVGRDVKSRKARHLQGVLQVALSEFRREVKAERGPPELPRRKRGS